MRSLSGAGRISLFLLLILSLGACAGRTMNKKLARDILVDLPGDLFDKDDVDIESVSTIGPRDALVETRLKTAFKLEKVDNRWVIREVRVGNHEWERFDLVLEALERLKADETRRLLEEVAQALELHAKDRSRIPEFSDYVELSDALHPEFLKSLIRLDAWRRPLAAQRQSGNRVRLISAGPDGRLATGDDIEIVRDFP